MELPEMPAIPEDLPFDPGELLAQVCGVAAL
jgi:hypothetical protein